MPMKKVRITLNAGSTGKKFYLFPSVEALYLWTCAMDRGEALEVPGIEELLLEPADFIEAELLGFEYVYDDAKHRRFDLVRLGRAHGTKNASGLQINAHQGWVTGNLLPLKQYSDAHINIRVINHDEERLDLSTLFSDEASED